MIWAENRKDASGAYDRRPLLCPAAGGCVTKTVPTDYIWSTPPRSRSTVRAVLLRGPSGAGKSDLALRLIDGGRTPCRRRSGRAATQRRAGLGRRPGGDRRADRGPRD